MDGTRENASKAESKSIFGGTISTKSSDENDSGHNPSTLQDGLEYSSSSQKSLGGSQLSSFNEGKTSTSRFRSVDFPSGSSSFPSKSLFGGKTSSDTLPFRDTPTDTLFGKTMLPPPSTSAITDKTDNIFGGKVTSASTYNFKPKSSSTISGAFCTPAPVFASQSKLNTKPKNVNMFGGKPNTKSLLESATSTDPFGSLPVKSSNPPPELSHLDRYQSTFETGSDQKLFKDLPRSSAVFDSSFERKSAEIKKPRKLIFRASKFNTEPSEEDASFTKSSSQAMPAQDTSLLLNKLSKETSEDSFDILDSVSKVTATHTTSPPKNSTMLIAVDIPKDFLDKSVLTNHFGKFGSVRKILINTKSNQASVYFHDHSSAAEAKLKGKKLHPLVPEMKLFFGAQSTLKKAEAPQKLFEPLKKPKVPLNVYEPPKKKKIPLKLFESVKSKSPVKVFEASQIQPKSSFSSIQPSSKPFESTPPKPSSEKEKSSSGALKRNEYKSKVPSGKLTAAKDVGSLLKSAAVNNYDKFLILDARDKNIRSQQKKVVDVNKAHYLQATCPDMCPEKERYSRDIQYDVSIYEMTKGEIDHKLSVKKFSRSSADKNEPLPHELRPGPVLKMTMDFLTCFIIEKGDEPNVQTDLWYNYLCNRTRGLRNDITQQHLLDHNAISVLERCTRFHIHCSHDLCEEPADYFDTKINTEHLTKSLQSLKELYHDMSEKGYLYNTESEFRAYEILLCVNDGNIIFKYLKFRDPVRKSEEVQFAVKVFNSIHTNNYVQFFHLLQKATYLQACIMHKHFTNVRYKALGTIVRAYSPQSLPAEKVMNMLGFSDESNFQTFVGYFGIEVSKDSKVILNKSKFCPKPEELPPVTKSLYMILVKKHCSIGEVIQNGTLPEMNIDEYHPHDSFDSAGYLKDEALDASDQCFKSPAEEESIEQSADDLVNERLQQKLFLKLKEMQRVKVLRRGFNAWRNFVNICKEKRKLEDERKTWILKKYTKIWKNKTKLSVELNRKVKLHTLSKYLHKWKCFAHHSKKMKSLVHKAKMVEKKMLTHKFWKIWKVKTDLKRSLREGRIARENLLALKFATKWRSYVERCSAERKSDSFYASKLMGRSFAQWKLWFAIRSRSKKSSFESFPAIGNLCSPEKQNQFLDWGYERDDSLNMSVYEISKIDEEIRIKSSKHLSLQQLSGIVAWTALPLLLRFESEVNSHPPEFSRNIFSECFKVLILIDFCVDLYLLEWVRTKFNILEEEDLSVPLQVEAKFASRHELSYTVIVSEKEYSTSSLSKLDGASFVVLVTNENKCEEVSHKASCLDIPYLILCKSKRKECLSSDLWLMAKETIDDPYTSEKLFNIVLNQWQLRDKQCDLQIGKCFTIMNKFISEKLLIPVYQIVGHRKLLGKLMPCPSKVVELYNDAIGHARTCLEISQTLSRDWMPSELLTSSSNKRFKCCKEEDTDAIMRTMQRALLPRFSLQPSSSMSFIEEQLASYVKDVVSCEDWGGYLFSDVRRIWKQFLESTNECEMNSTSSSEMYHMPWIDILNCCILHKLSLFSEVDVAYNRSKLEAFDSDHRLISDIKTSETTRIWLQDEESASKRKAYDIESNSEPKKKKKIESVLLREIAEEKKASFDYEAELKNFMLVEEELKSLCPGYDSIV